MASGSLLHSSTAFAPAFLPLQSRRRSASQLHLRSSPHRRRGVSLAASSAASPDVEKEPSPSPSPSPSQEESPLSAVADSVKVLKEAAKTKKVPAPEVLSALAKIKKAKLDTSTFFETLGGTESPGRTWMLIFTAKGRLDKGQYFPVTAVQRFDAAGKRIENGIYLGPIGCLTFEGRLSWKKKILAFIFERVRIKVGPFGPLEIGLGGGDDAREPSTKDPFFVWFYVDEEIAVAQGRGGGVAYWCRSSQIGSVHAWKICSISTVLRWIANPYTETWSKVDWKMLAPANFVVCQKFKAIVGQSEPGGFTKKTKRFQVPDVSRRFQNQMCNK